MVLLPGAASTSRRRNRLKGIKMDGDELRDIYSGIQETPYFMGFFEIEWEGWRKIFCSDTMGNNPMVGATVAVAVSVQQAADEGKF